MLRYFVVILLIGPLAAPAFSTGALERVRAEGVLRIGTDATYPPFEAKAGDRFEGFDIDLGELIGQELGVRVAWTNMSFDGIFPALLAKKFDLVMSSVTITPERQAKMAFSCPYYNAGQIIAVQRGEPRFRSLADLAGQEVGAQINTTGQVELEKRGDVHIKKFNSIDLALLDLKNGRLAAVVSDAPTVRYMLKRGFPNLTTVGEPFTSEHYGIALRPEDTDLLAAVNAALARLAETGAYARQHEKWFGVAAEMPSVSGPPEQVEGKMVTLSGREGAETPSERRVLRPLLRGLALTVRLTTMSLLCGLPLGLLIGLARITKFRPLAWVAGLYVEFMRGTPLLVQIFAIYFVLPTVGLNLPPFPCALVAFSLNAAAYLAEIFRAGIQSIDVGQMEAAQSLGMTYGLAMRLVILPQAIRRVIPPLTNEAIALLKDTSLVSVIAISELTRTGSELASRLADPLRVWPLVALLYLAMTFPLTRLTHTLERRWEVGQRG
jgi:His/Glu/Gln/Arg/opine family amino acid ABC transporter permease subunit